MGAILIPLMFITSCKKDEGVAPDATTSISAENLGHHKSWSDTVHNSPGAVTGVTGTASATGSTTGTTTGGTTTSGSTTGGTATSGSTTGGTATSGSTTTGGTATSGSTTTGGTTTKPTTGTTTGTPTTGSTATGSTTTTTKPTTGTTTGSTTTGSTTTKPATTTPPATTVTYQASAAITLTGKSNMLISGLAVPSITLNNCTNITIKNCKIGPAGVCGVTTYMCTGITIDSCLISNVTTGVYAIQSQTIVVSNCQGKNMQGPFPRGQFVQFNNVTGSGNRIINNKFQNILGQSNPEDAINIYESSGLPGDPITVSGNEIRGGGPSTSGSGIMLGDTGGSYELAQNNTLVDPGQVGMAIAGGTNMSVINNSIYSKQQSFTNVGLYYWNQSGQASSNITMSGNQVNWTSSTGNLNNTWLPQGTTAPTGWSTNVYNNSLSESLLPNAITTL
jgi:hypothetical protein